MGAGSASPRHSIDGLGSILPIASDEGVQLQSTEPMVASKGGAASSSVPTSPTSPPGGSRRGLLDNPGGSLSREAKMKEELDEAKRELAVRTQKFRDELVEDMRAHEVSLLARPTTAELEDKKMANLQSLRRRHHKVVVGADDKEIRKMPNHKLCISDDLKRSLSKMRENLFQRRLNLAIYEKTVGDWAMPQLRVEVRRRKRAEAKNQSQGGTASLGGSHAAHAAPSAATTQQPASHAEPSSAVGTASLEVTAIAAGTGGAGPPASAVAPGALASPLQGEEPLSA